MWQEFEFPRKLAIVIYNSEHYSIKGIPKTISFDKSTARKIRSHSIGTSVYKHKLRRFGKPTVYFPQLRHKLQCTYALLLAGMTLSQQLDVHKQCYAFDCPHTE